MITVSDRPIQALVTDIDSGKLLMPEFQRGFVWKTYQVRNLFDSLYHQYPSGQLLFWETDDLPVTRTASVEGVLRSEHRPLLVLDGQQRLTSLSTIMLGRDLEVKDRRRPIDIVFNVFNEKFEVAGPRQRGQPGWISLGKFFSKGSFSIFNELNLDSYPLDEKQKVHDRLTRLENIKTYPYRIITLEQLSYDEVTHIFVRVNSGGTKLTTGDLALAQVSSRWHGITVELEHYLSQVNKTGFDLDTGFMLRFLLTIMTGQSRFNLWFRGDRQEITLEELQAAWKRTKQAVDQTVNFVMQNCLIDRPKLMRAKNLLVPLAVFFDRHGGNVISVQAHELQRWVYMALIWARYSGATETALDQDITALDRPQPITAMIRNIEDKVGRRPITERELQNRYQESPYTLMMYVLARRANAQDWFNGVALGPGQALEAHHIFPKAVLAKQGYDLWKDRNIVDQLANIAFLSDKANLRISKTPPSKYLPDIDEARLRAQYIPLDRSLWEPDRFQDFLLERRKLLADAVDRLLLSLSEEPAPWPPDSFDALLEVRVDALERQLRDLIAERLTADQGDYAWDHCVPPDIRKTVKSRIDQVIEKNPFDQDKYDPMAAKLEQCQFSDYPKIITANWSLFDDVFPNQHTFTQHFAATTDARNNLKHHKEFNSVDRSLADAGITWLENCLRTIALKEDAEAEEEVGASS